jgi:transcriptional regulator with PAS, ATPase and Fis domain
MSEIVLRVPDHIGKDIEHTLETTMQNVFGCMLSCIYCGNVPALEHMLGICANLMEENMKPTVQKTENDML